MHIPWRRTLIATCALCALALPSAAQGASGTSDVAGTAGAELSLSVATPTAMTFTPSVDGVSSSVVTVTSTQATWAWTIHDAGVTTPGQMDKVNCATRAPLTGSLENPLQWKLSGGSYANLSGTPAAVRTGSLVEANTVEFQQPVGSTEDITAADCYQLTVTHTVT